MLKRLSVLVVMISAVFGTVLIATPASAAPVCQREIEPPPDCPPQEDPPPPSDPMMDPDPQPQPQPPGVPMTPPSGAPNAVCTLRTFDDPIVRTSDNTRVYINRIEVDYCVIGGLMAVRRLDNFPVLTAPGDPFLTVSGPGSVAIFGNGTTSVLFRTELNPRYCIWSACQTYSHTGFGSINSSGANVDFDLVRLS